LPEEWQRQGWQADARDAVKAIGKLLMEKIPRAKWHRALYDALQVAQRIEDKIERDQFEHQLKVIEN
jgi:hypothetical protein